MIDLEQKTIEDFNNRLLKNKAKIIKHIESNYKIDNFFHISNYYMLLHYIKNYRFCRLNYFDLSSFVSQQLIKVINIYTGYSYNKVVELIAYINTYNINNFKY